MPRPKVLQAPPSGFVAVKEHAPAPDRQCLLGKAHPTAELEPLLTGKPPPNAQHRTVGREPVPHQVRVLV